MRVYILCVCVRACVRECVRACVRACLRACMCIAARAPPRIRDSYWLSPCYTTVPNFNDTNHLLCSKHTIQVQKVIPKTLK